MFAIIVDLPINGDGLLRNTLACLDKQPTKKCIVLDQWFLKHSIKEQKNTFQCHSIKSKEDKKNLSITFNPFGL